MMHTSPRKSYETCWRCLLKSHIFLRPKPGASSASFTTSYIHRESYVKKAKIPGGRPNVPQKGRPATFLGKKRSSLESRPKKTAIGERQALRKRIVLSNNNAIAVQGVSEFEPGSIGNAQLHGQMVDLSVSMVDRLRAVEAFKKTQNWGLFRKPAMLVRQETIDYGNLFNELSQEQPGSRRSIRRILVGERGSGKSMLVLQAMTMAFLKGWVVINLPEAQNIVIGHTEYAPIPQTSPRLYQQRMYTASLLSAISRANPILSSLTLQTQPPPAPIAINPSSTLSQFADLGASNPELAYPIFQTLMQDLLLPSRPPLLLCIDSLGHAMKDSGYRTADFQIIHSHDLAIVKWFMSHLSGTSPLPNGGIVLAATSESNKLRNISLEAALGILEFNSSSSPPNPYPQRRDSTFAHNPNSLNPLIKYDQHVLDVLLSRPGIEIQRVKGLSRDEARGLMEYWAKSGVLRSRISDGFVGEKWALSGGGVVGELERATVGMKI